VNEVADRLVLTAPGVAELDVHRDVASVDDDLLHLLRAHEVAFEIRVGKLAQTLLHVLFGHGHGFLGRDRPRPAGANEKNRGARCFGIASAILAFARKAKVHRG